jgi:Mn2+/Fe2+ NRAMP family transporter
VGAQTAYQLSWVALLTAPLLGVVLAIAAQVGVVARADLQSLVMKRYGQTVSRVLLVSVVVVNLVTIAADLQAGAAGIGMLAGVGSGWLILPLGLALAGLLLIGRYDEVVTVLRYLLIGFLAFGAAAVLARPDWSQVIRGTLVPVAANGSPSGHAIRTRGRVHVARSAREMPCSPSASQIRSRQARAVRSSNAPRTAT